MFFALLLWNHTCGRNKLQTIQGKLVQPCIQLKQIKNSNVYSYINLHVIQCVWNFFINYYFIQCRRLLMANYINTRKHIQHPLNKAIKYLITTMTVMGRIIINIGGTILWHYLALFIMAFCKNAILKKWCKDICGFTGICPYKSQTGRMHESTIFVYDICYWNWLHSFIFLHFLVSESAIFIIFMKTCNTVT